MKLDKWDIIAIARSRVNRSKLMFWSTIAACIWLLGAFIYLLFGMDFVDVLISMVLIATCVAWYGALLIVLEIRANKLAVKLKEELDENSKG
jgi:hypothetical protein